MKTEILGVYGDIVKVRETTWFRGTEERAVRVLFYEDERNVIRLAFYTDTYENVPERLFNRLRNAILHHAPKK